VQEVMESLSIWRSRENVAKRKPADFLFCELALNGTPDE